MLHGIFYARFLTTKGATIVYQSPPDCMVSRDATKPSEIDLLAVSEFIIPRQGFCNRFITFREPGGKYVILGYPVLISNQKYERNEFIFNFGVIVPIGYDTAPYEAVVRRLADTFREMEVQNQYLSLEGVAEGKSIGGVLEIIREDLNNYNECMIPIDNATTINTKLFPVRPDPPAVKAWHVPLAKLNFNDIMDDKWDLTMRKVVCEIDGVRDVRKVAHHADVSLELTKLAMKHLLYYDTILLLDIFFFTNMYAIATGIDDFMADRDGIQEECARYVFLGDSRLQNFWLCRSYTLFQQGRTVKEWLRLLMEQGLDVMRFVDVRRLVQFGVIRGILYRQHKWPVMKRGAAGLVGAVDAAAVPFESAVAGHVLAEYLDGCHCFDQITTEMHMTDEEIGKSLAKLPKRDVEILYR